MYWVKILITPANYKLHRPIISQRCAISRTAPVAVVDHPMQTHLDRKPCFDPPPPEPKRSRKWVKWVLGAGGIAATGGFVVFARNNAEVRDWLSIQAPWFDEFIAIVYKENSSYSESMTKAVNYTYGRIDNYIKVWQECDKPEKPTLAEQHPYCLAKDLEGKEPEPEPEIVCNRGILEDKTCVEEPPPIFLNDVCEVEKCLLEYKNTIESNYKRIINKNKEVSNRIDVISRTFNAINHDRFEKLMAEKSVFVFNAMEKINDAKKCLESLTAYFEKCGDVKLSKEVYENTKNVLKDIRAKVQNVQRESELQEYETAMLEKQWRLINDSNNMLIVENQKLMNDLNYSNNKPKLAGDPDLLLIHTRRYIKMLEKNRDEAVEVMKDRSNRVFKGDAKKLKFELPKKIKEEQSKYKNLEDELAKSLEDKRQKTIEKMKCSFLKTIPEKVAAFEEEMMNSFDDRIEDAKQKERAKFEPQIKELEQKLVAIEAVLEERKKIEDEMKRCKRVHEAASGLIEAMMRGECRVDVSEELKVLDEAGKHDELVAKVVKSIPPDVRKKGVVPESNLWKGFQNMETIALKVALVEDEGTRMPVYWLSYLQYILLSFRPETIPEAEAEKIPEKVPENLDTFDILQRARYYASKREFAAAVHYVDALKGASRSAARDWLENAKEHVDTRIAAEAVMAHATSVCLRHV